MPVKRKKGVGRAQQMAHWENQWEQLCTSGLDASIPAAGTCVVQEQRLCYGARIDPKLVSDRLGHSGIGIAIDTYAHMVLGLQEAAAQRFEEWLERPTARSQGGKPETVSIAT